MLTFKQYIIESTRNDVAIFHQNENMQHMLSKDPFKIDSFQKYDIDRMFNEMGVTIGERREKCDNIVDGIARCKLILKYKVIVSGTPDKNNLYYYITSPDIYHFMKYSDHNISPDNPLFAMYTIPLSSETTNMTALENQFRVFNYYQSLQDKIESKALKTIKTLEYAKQTNLIWLDGWDIVLNQLKMKYLPSSDLTDDDYALNAAHNL